MPPPQERPDSGSTLYGSVSVLLQFDVCEEIRLDRLQNLIGGSTVEKPRLKHPSPKYIRYKRPPVMEPTEPLVLDTGERLAGEIKYYDYGVLSVVFEQTLVTDWEKLTQLASRWVWEIDFAERAMQIVRKRLATVAPALVKPYEE